MLAHPSPDLYGSDRQLLESVAAFRDAGWRVTVSLPADGPLTQELSRAGAQVTVLDVPVLRKASLRPRGLLDLVRRLGPALLAIRRLLRHERPALVYVNTVTIPIWLAGARWARIPALCHVHEAEESQPLIIRRALALPLFLATGLVANSAAARSALTAAWRRLNRRITVIYNGMPGPEAEPVPRPRAVGDPARLVLVARLSPRKGIDLAIDAVALLRAEGREVSLRICGSVFPGYEWYEAQLNDQIHRLGLEDAVELAGYVHPTWPELAAADAVLVPSRTEPFGNTAVEGLLAGRPVVAARVQGLAEILSGDHGVLVPPEDSASLAAAIGRLLDDPADAARLAAAGRVDALQRFAPDRYRQQILAEADRLTRAGLPG